MYAVEGLNKLAKQVHLWAVGKGWWPLPLEGGPQPKTFLEQCALFHTEISEAVEAWRNGHEPKELYYLEDKPEGIPAELADLLLRVLDTCGKYDIDIEQAIREKMLYNVSRPQRHGGKRA
jgi:NTP pyrophosphatase (non-canonical NTP hydrolase)